MLKDLAQHNYIPMDELEWCYGDYVHLFVNSPVQNHLPITVFKTCGIFVKTKTIIKIIVKDKLCATAKSFGHDCSFRSAQHL